MKITVLSGGVGGARFISGLLAAKAPEDEVTVIGNTADDIWVFGLRVCPDLDTVMYTLGGGIDAERKWGRTDETWNAKEDLAAYGAGSTWFGLGDRDLATHLIRTEMLRDGHGLATITDRLCERWQPGVRLLPMTEDEVETHITTDDGIIHFQEYWIRLRATVPVRGLEFVGAEKATAGPGVVEAIMTADRVILPPSNPIVSTGAILSVAEIARAVRETPAPVVGVSPIIGGAAVRGMADQLLTGLGLEISASGVARHFGARSSGGLLDGWLIDSADVAELPAVEESELVGRAVPLYMSDDDLTAQLARDTLALAAELAGR
ncbi:2-phospho-L-lactate transferase [Aeromicrobium sp. P5_D10]